MPGRVCPRIQCASVAEEEERQRPPEDGARAWHPDGRPAQRAEEGEKAAGNDRVEGTKGRRHGRPDRHDALKVVEETRRNADEQQADAQGQFRRIARTQGRGARQEVTGVARHEQRLADSAGRRNAKVRGEGRVRQRRPDGCSCSDHPVHTATPAHSCGLRSRHARCRPPPPPRGWRAQRGHSQGAGQPMPCQRRSAALQTAALGRRHSHKGRDGSLAQQHGCHERQCFTSLHPSGAQKP